MSDEKPRWEKMSKSRGNVITPDEIIYGVAEVQSGYEFRFLDGMVINDFRKLGVWQDKPRDGMFYTSTRIGKQPVFLCQKGDPGVPAILVNGREVMQHEHLLSDENLLFLGCFYCADLAVIEASNKDDPSQKIGLCQKHLDEIKDNPLDKLWDLLKPEQKPIVCDVWPCDKQGVPAVADVQWGSDTMVVDNKKIPYQIASMCQQHVDELWMKINTQVQLNKIWFRIDEPGKIKGEKHVVPTTQANPPAADANKADG